MSFYFIFSGSVGVAVKGDEDSVCSNDEKPANILRKGDAFGVRISVCSFFVTHLITFHIGYSILRSDTIFICLPGKIF